MHPLLVILALCVFPIFSGCAPVSHYLPFSEAPRGNQATPFEDIQVPAQLSKTGKGYVTDNSSAGFAVYEGYISPSNLQHEMHRIMQAHGWKLVSAAGTTQNLLSVYQNNSRYAVLRMYTLTAAGTGLEIWASPESSDGYPPIPYAPPRTPSTPARTGSQPYIPESAPDTAPERGGNSGGLQEHSL